MKLRLHFAAAGLAGAAALLAACAQHESPKTQAPAGAATSSTALGTSTVKAPDGTPINESIYRFYTENTAQKAPEDLTDEQRKQALENLESLQLLANAAQTKGLPQERTIAVELELQRQKLLASAMINRYIEEHPATDDEIKAAYQANLPNLGATQYKARHILVKTEDEAKAIIAQLDKGADFAELAKKKSTGPTGPSGGDLGWFTAQSMVKPFADAVKDLKVGSYTSEPVKTQYGWHVIELEDKKDSDPPSLDSVKDKMTAAVNKQKIDAYIESLKNAAAKDAPPK